MTFVRDQGGDVLLDVRLTPRASRDRIGPVHESRLKVAVTSPPVDREANEHLVQLMAKRLCVPKSNVTIEHGETSRNKTLRIRGVASETVAAILARD
ncbi:MAG: YggU family protein [Deltaproteobacteria bacterium]|nr:YggU family protein [Deltaproteobacteria bacterium]